MRVDRLHMINCQNLFSQPLDPLFLGMSLKENKDILVKCYDSSKLNFMPKNAQFLAQNSQGHLEMVHVDTCNDFNKAFSKTEQNFNPRYLYLVDLVIKFDFLAGPELKTFNYMQKYFFISQIQVQTNRVTSI